MIFALLSQTWDHPLLLVLFILALLLPCISIPCCSIYVLAMFLWRRIQKKMELPPKWVRPIPESFCTTSHDGLKLHYSVIQGDSDAPIMLLCCPLGQCGMGIYYPIISLYGKQYTYVSWDYRGFFQSQEPSTKRRLSIYHNAEDGFSVLKAMSPKKPYAAACVGHSMGVQVGLEMALLYPDSIGSLILLNGAHGQVFQTAFQPLFRVPCMGDCVRHLVTVLLSHPYVLETFRFTMKPVFDVVTIFIGALFGDNYMKFLLGPGYLQELLDLYLSTICTSAKNTESFLRLFEELDAHSVYHLLEFVEQPVLLISGLWDVLTPAYHSFEMARRIRKARHVCDPFSSHATILENPRKALLEIQTFLTINSEAIAQKSLKMLCD